MIILTGIGNSVKNENTQRNHCLNLSESRIERESGPSDVRITDYH